MLGIKDNERIFFVSGYTDMRSGRYTLARIVQMNLGMDPYDGSLFVFMSKDHRKMKALSYKRHMYILYDLCYDHGYRFMKVGKGDGSDMSAVEEMGWNHLAALLQCPARTMLPL